MESKFILVKKEPKMRCILFLWWEAIMSIMGIRRGRKELNNKLCNSLICISHEKAEINFIAFSISEVLVSGVIHYQWLVLEEEVVGKSDWVSYTFQLSFELLAGEWWPELCHWTFICFVRIKAVIQIRWEMYRKRGLRMLPTWIKWLKWILNGESVSFDRSDVSPITFHDNIYYN